MKRVYLIFIFAGLVLTAFAQGVLTHTVKQGETFNSIASLYGITTEELLNANKGNADIVFPGLLLNIPKKKQEVKSEKQPAPQVITDCVELTDGSYILCKVISAKSGWVTFEQEEVAGTTLRIAIKEVVQIKYKNGSVKRYKK